MRRILVETARRKSRARHGSGLERVSAEEVEIAAVLPPERLLQVNEALDHLAEEAPEAAQVVKLRYFAGLTQPEVAQMLGISLRAAEAEHAADAGIVRRSGVSVPIRNQDSFRRTRWRRSAETPLRRAEGAHQSAAR